MKPCAGKQLGVINMVTQSIKTYNIFLATETQQNHDNRRLLVATLIDNGRGRQARCVVLPLRQDATLEDEINKAVHYVLGFTPVPNRELSVNFIHSYPGSVNLPLSHSKVKLQYISTVQNPALQPLKNYSRNLAPMI
jgi:hypothetical protein